MILIDKGNDLISLYCSFCRNKMSLKVEIGYSLANNYELPVDQLCRALKSAVGRQYFYF